MSLQSLRNLEKKCEKKLSILRPFNKNCDVTTRICIYSIFKSHVIQNQVKFGTLMIQHEKKTKT